MSEETDRQPMREVSHTNPYTGETFSTVYQRGPAVADGGETRTETDERPEEMKDVDHTPPHGDSANDVWERGGEDDENADASETVESEAEVSADAEDEVDE